VTLDLACEAARLRDAQRLCALDAELHAGCASGAELLRLGALHGHPQAAPRARALGALAAARAPLLARVMAEAAIEAALAHMQIIRVWGGGIFQHFDVLFRNVGRHVEHERDSIRLTLPQSAVPIQPLHRQVPIELRHGHHHHHDDHTRLAVATGIRHAGQHDQQRIERVAGVLPQHLADRSLLLSRQQIRPVAFQARGGFEIREAFDRRSDRCAGLEGIKPAQGQQRFGFSGVVPARAKRGRRPQVILHGGCRSSASMTDRRGWPPILL
jgi:hypothetical protein